jgi:hypothetical protein
MEKPGISPAFPCRSTSRDDFLGTGVGAGAVVVAL